MQNEIQRKVLLSESLADIPLIYIIRVLAKVEEIYYATSEKTNKSSKSSESLFENE